MSSTISRRAFLRASAAGLCGSAIHQVLSPFDGGGISYAAGAPSNKKVMVLINLSGGASYNVCPIYHGAYRSANPTISYGPEESLPLTNEQGLHPDLTNFHSVYKSGHLALINKVGYSVPNRSHDESTRIWFRGSRKNLGNGGWAGRFTCQLANTYSGISLLGYNELLETECKPPHSLVLGDLDALNEFYLGFGGVRNSGADQFWGGSNFAQWLGERRSAMIDAGNSGVNSAHDYLKATNQSYEERVGHVRDSVKTVPQAISPITQYYDATTDPHWDWFPQFARQCRNAVRLIAAEQLGVQFIYIQVGGFDTHADEKDTLSFLMKRVNVAVGRMVGDIQALGRWQDVTIVTMSEFSRTFENGSLGTDHGHAAPMLIMGGAVKGGIKSPVPSAAETTSALGRSHYYDDYSVDFRQPFAAVISHMGYDAQAVFTEPISARDLQLF